MTRYPDGLCYMCRRGAAQPGDRCPNCGEVQPAYFAPKPFEPGEVEFTISGEEINKMTDKPTTEQLVADRGKVHGDFTKVSEYAQHLKDIAERSVNWSNGMTSVQREGVSMILHKVARILAGDPNHHDHWDDIAGYATITSKRIPRKTEAQVDLDRIISEGVARRVTQPTVADPKLEEMTDAVCVAAADANGGFLSERVANAIRVAIQRSM